MKSKLLPFIAGVLTTTIIGSLCATALAVSGSVSFSTTNIKVNGEKVASAGDTYTLDNGTKVPYSITYTDENGGGTIYVPIRKFSELVGTDVGWDRASSSVTVGEGDTTPTATSSPTPTEMPPALTATPETTDTVTPADYSDWTAEEEVAYQEFKAMWEVRYKDSGDAKYRMDGTNDGIPWESYSLFDTTNLSYTDICNVIEQAKSSGFTVRLAKELRSKNIKTEVYFWPKNGQLIYTEIVYE